MTILTNASTASQNIDQDANNLAVVEDSTIKYASFSNMVEKTANNGYQVNVRLPSNVFDFSSETPITVSGSLEMQLAESTGMARKLRSGVVEPESALFKLDITLGGVTDDISETQTKKEEGKTYPGYLIPLLAAVGFASLVALSGMAVAIHKRGAQYSGSAIRVEV